LFSVKKIAQITGTALAVAGALILFLSVPGQTYSSYVASRFDPSQATKKATMISEPPREDRQEETGTIAVTAKETIEEAPISEATWINIPSIQIDSRVIEIGVKKEKGEWIWEAPAFAVGHYGGTANPGEIGNAVFTGHIRSNPIKEEGSVFGRLPEIELGQTVYLKNAYGRQFTYLVVEMKVVLPTETNVLDPTPDETLTLITCVPDWVYSHRLVVIAKPVPEKGTSLAYDFSPIPVPAGPAGDAFSAAWQLGLSGGVLAHTQPAASISPGLTPIFHWVSAGETLSQIAQRYGVTPEAIAAANRLSSQNYIITGMPLTIPRRP
jgi:LPXTG-site transpeptidase (sortase) family protein